MQTLLYYIYTEGFFRRQKINDMTVNMLPKQKLTPQKIHENSKHTLSRILSSSQVPLAAVKK